VNALDPILATTRSELAQRRLQVPHDELERAATMREEFRPFAEALVRPGLSLIAEHKRRSPSAGPIRDDLDLEDVVRAYERGGAVALSVLTEGENFGGSLADLLAARAASSLPILRKDFVLERYQLLEAVAAGADAVLLIVAALAPAELEELYRQATALGLATLVEVHDAAELELALSLGVEIVGINNRDLTTLEVDTQRTYELLPHAREAATVVAESGFSSREELAALAQAGVDAVLVGEALMRAEDIEAACRALTLERSS
jgi:indole-3-glycerol phosphate synthase